MKVDRMEDERIIILFFYISFIIYNYIMNITTKLEEDMEGFSQGMI